MTLIKDTVINDGIYVDVLINFTFTKLVSSLGVVIVGGNLPKFITIKESKHVLIMKQLYVALFALAFINYFLGIFEMMSFILKQYKIFNGFSKLEIIFPVLASFVYLIIGYLLTLFCIASQITKVFNKK